MYLKLIFVVACKLYFLTLRLTIHQTVHEGMSSYATCDVVDVNLNISLRLRKRQSVYQGMSSFECSVDVNVNCSFSLSLRLRSSVPHDASTCAGRYVLELMLFFFTFIRCPYHFTFIWFFLGVPIGSYSEHPWEIRPVHQASCQERRAFSSSE